MAAAKFGEYDEFPVLFLSGDLDMAAEEMLDEQLAELLKADTCVIIHVLAVSYMDSSVIGKLLGAQSTLDRRGDGVAFVGWNPNVLRVLGTLGLASHMGSFVDLEDAAEHLRALSK